MPINLADLPGRLKRLRESAGYSQADFARMAGITQGQVSNYEVGRAFPGLESTIAMAGALGTTVAALLDESEPVRAPPRPATRNEMALWIIEAIGIDGFALDRIRSVLLDRDHRK